MSTSPPPSTPPSNPPTHSPPTPPKNPLILILGPTGTGKSLLALSLFPPTPTSSSPSFSPTFSSPRHEILNSDAPQLYLSLPIITNKLPPSAQQGIPHHLLDFVPLTSPPWTVQRYVRESKQIISDVQSRGRVPVMVGGTGYYAFSTIFGGAVLGDDSDGNGKGIEGLSDGVTVAFTPEEEAMGLEILNGSTEEMLAKLHEVDPEMARSWHPRDRRKIQRSLEICLRRSRRVSEIYAEQVARAKEVRGGEDGIGGDVRVEGGLDGGNERSDEVKYGAAGSLNYDTLILWLSAADLPLKERLNARVDKMVAQGLFEEALDLTRLSQQNQTSTDANTIDHSKGIWVSIGYKELSPWATAYLQSPSEYPKDGPLARECIEAVKAATRQYAKRQDRYIRIRLANALKRAGALDRLFLLDSTDLSRWDEDVVAPARRIVDAFLAGEQLPVAAEMSALAKENFDRIASQGGKSSYRVAKQCEVCGKTTMTEKEWEGHIRSRSHRNALARKKRLALVKVEEGDPQQDGSVDPAAAEAGS